MKNQTYILDGDSTPFTFATIGSLGIGASLTIGGGAAATFTITRTA